MVDSTPTLPADPAVTEPVRPGADWWRTAVTYEIYPRSFCDSDGDGEGDLRGIISRLPYLTALGVDAIWITPWYPSPLVDGGYDVSDYRDIHPMFGTLADAIDLLDAAHAHGLRVIIDLVANHTSDQYPWFREAVAAGRGSVERERYLFRDGRGAAGELPPNNWMSAFGQPAWTRIEEPDGSAGQWYFHTFAPEQPDLNWENSEVLDEFDSVLRFWLDNGVDGFRLDAVPAMVKAPGLPDAHYEDISLFAAAQWVDNPHWDVDGVHEILRRWRRLIDAYGSDRIFVAEAVVNGPERLARYLRPDELHTAFNFQYVHARWDPADLHRAIDETLAALRPVGAPATWMMSSHDEVRHLTRFGQQPPAGTREHGTGETDLDLGTRRARAAVLLTLALPGGAYLYQGEELGLPEVEDLPAAARRDPIYFRSGGTRPGRDGCRVPLPWSGEQPPFGFAPASTGTWLPQPVQWSSLTAAAQERHPDSMLGFYREALAWRRRLDDLRGEDLVWLPAPKGTLHFRRGNRFRCVVNLSDRPIDLAGEVVLASAELDEHGRLPPDATAWTQAA